VVVILRVGKARIIAGVEAPRAVKIDDVAEGADVDGLDGGGRWLRM
jgi:hypothetical protein